MNPLISIIVPVYNVEKYVLKCLESLKNQSYEDIEILVVDDGSTDGSGKICDDFVKTEKRAKVFHKKNGGLSDARNFGIKKAKGECVVFVDSDDYVKKDFVKKLYEAAKDNDADISVCGYNDVLLKNEALSGREAAIRLLTEQENIEILVWNKMYKTKLFTEKNIYFPVGEKHEDVLTTYKLLSVANKVSYISESLYCYVERSGSITKEEKVEERLMMRERAAKEAIHFFKDDKELKKAAEVSLILAKYAFLDFAISGKIEKKYGIEAKKWIKAHAGSYKDNEYLSKKTKTYNLMVNNCGGILYTIFRNIRHE